MTNPKSTVVMSLVLLFILFVALPAALIRNYSKENSTSTTNASSVDTVTPVYSEENSEPMVDFSGSVYLEVTALYEKMKQEGRPLDITKVLLPCENKETNSEKDDSKTYIRILDFKTNESVSFEVGHIKDCDEGCAWDDENCLPACTTVNLNNDQEWVRVKTTESNIVLNRTAPVIFLLADGSVTD